MPRHAQGPAVVNDLMGEENPFILRDHFHQILLDLDGLGVFRQIETARQSLHVRVDDDARCDSVSCAENYVGGLARRAGNREQLIHRLRDLSTEIIQHSLRRADQRFGLVVEEAGGSDILRHLGLARVSEIGDRRILPEQARRHFVYAPIGALCRENGRHQQLPGIVVVQRARGVRVHQVQQIENLCDAHSAFSGGFRTRHQFGRSGGARRIRSPLGFWHTDIILSRRATFLVVVALIAFGGCLGGSFHFDDYSLFGGSFWHPFPTRPLTYLTFSINGWLPGRNPAGYHAVNLGLHIAAVLLAYRAFQKLIGEWPALMAAAIFAIHPFQAEPVNYIFARSTLLETVGCLAALLAWSRERHWWALAWFGGALLSKEECVAFPIFLALLEISTLKQVRHWKPIAAMLGLALITGSRVLYIAQATPGSAAGAQAGISPAAYALTQGTVIWRYLRMLVFPWGFTVDPEISVPPPAVGLLAWILLAALTVLAATRFTGLRPGFWFIAGLILLLPSSSILPASDLAADRRMYLPMIGFTACAALLLQRMRAAVLAAALAMLIALSFARTEIWRTEESLWSDAAAKAPHKVRPKIQLARAVEPARALELLKQAEGLAPGDPVIASDEGRIYLESGRPELAFTAFGRALALAPGSADALNNRGAALLAMGQRDAARQDFERALAANPCQFNARQNLLRIGVSAPGATDCGFSREQLDALGER